MQNQSLPYGYQSFQNSRHWNLSFCAIVCLFVGTGVSVCQVCQVFRGFLASRGQQNSFWVLENGCSEYVRCWLFQSSFGLLLILGKLAKGDA